MNTLFAVRAHRSVLAASTLMLALAGTPVWAQSQPAAPMIKAGQVTEDLLVDALAIDVPMSDEAASGTTRSIRPSMRPTAAQKPAGPGKASLLISFATGSADLTRETIQVLQTVAKALQSDRLAGFAFRVEGHADPRGGTDYNLKLSQDRAQAVVAYLTGTLGVLPDRLAAVGKGASELVDTRHPDSPENRRVTIVTNR